MLIDVAELYRILAAVALAPGGGLITYGQLSSAYQDATGEWHEPHGTWDVPLGELNTRLARAGLPPLSALVVLADPPEPGGGFWGSAPGIPPRPRDSVERVAAWSAIVKQVQGAEWPGDLP